MLGHQVRHYDFHSVPLRQAQQVSWNPRKMMEHVPGLPLIPPPQWLDGNASLLQSCHCLLDLHLQTAVRQRERILVVEKYFHLSVSAFQYANVGTKRRRQPEHSVNWPSEDLREALVG